MSAAPIMRGNTDNWPYPSTTPVVFHGSWLYRKNTNLASMVLFYLFSGIVAKN